LTSNPGFLLTVLAFVLVIGPLVFVHEMGHYLAARWCGVTVDAFSIGFGREVAGWTDRRGTRWKLGWLPLGGYVRFAGDMNAVSQPSADWLALPPEERNRTFQAKPVWQRAIIVAAGPVINFVFAVVILAGFAWTYGDMRTPPVAAAIVPDSAAAAAGLRPGDRVVALNGRAMETFDDLSQYILIRPGEAMRVTLERGGRRLDRTITIGRAQEVDRFGNRFERGLLGLAPGAPVRVEVGLLDAPGVAVRRTGDILRFMTDTLGQIVSGRRPASELGGPLSIAQVSGQQLSLGWADFVGLLALVSINLGFINLLPVPMLDGGHLMFYAVEAVRRRPVGPAAQEWAFRGGLAAILALMLFVTFNDLGRLGVWKGLAGLIG
jgi:regulator of sigma E protease